MRFDVDTDRAGSGSILFLIKLYILYILYVKNFIYILILIYLKHMRQATTTFILYRA